MKSLRSSVVQRAIVALLGLAVCLTAAFAIQVPQEKTRFDGLLIPDPQVVVAAETVSGDSLSATDPRGMAVKAFRTAYGPKWDIHFDFRSGVPLMIQGQGIPWIPGSGNNLHAAGAVTTDSLAASLRTFVKRNEALLGVNDQELVLNREASVQMTSDLWQVQFTHQVNGIPVRGDQLVFYVSHGNLVSFGASRWTTITTSPVPSVAAEAARNTVYTFMGLGNEEKIDLIDSGSLSFTPTTPAGTPQDAYAGPVGHGYDTALSYTVVLRLGNQAQTWVGIVNAHTGAIIGFFDDTKYAQVKGGVYPVSNDGGCPDGCEQPNYPMPYADITISGSPSTANSMGIFSCTPGGSTATTALAGPYVRVNDTCGAVSQSTTCDSDIDLGVSAGTDCVVPAGASAGDTHSARTGFYWLNRIKEHVRPWFAPGHPWLNAQLTDNVNINSTCNAFWNGTTVNFYRSGGGCRNTGEIAGVFLHEWGHGLSVNDGAGSNNPDEANADITSFIYLHNSCIGRGFFQTGTCDGYGNACIDCTGIRDQDWGKRVNNSPSTPEGFIAGCSGGSGPCGKETHCEGYLAGETLWDVATRDLPASGLDQNTAWQLVDKLWYVSRIGSSGALYGCAAPADTRSCGATTMMQQMRVVDDDDGNLANGTPHAAAIFSAFNRHNITCGAAADPSNQSTTSCPTLAATALSVTSGSGSVSLSWTAVPNAVQYRVLRNDISCDTAYTTVGIVGSTNFTDTGLVNGYPVYYTIQAIGSNASCEGILSNCVQAIPQPCAGSVSLDRAGYNCSDSIAIRLVDSDLVGGLTHTVDVSSDTEAGPETITLTESPANSGIFLGSITTTSAGPSGDGMISVSNGNTVNVRYHDDDFCGTPNVDVDQTATIDCLGPIITNVHETNVSGNGANILWDTNELSNSYVVYDTVSPPTTFNQLVPALATSHVVPLTGLDACTQYWYEVQSTDAAANSATDNNGNNYYTFTTGQNVTPTYTYAGPPVIILDNNTANPALAPINVADSKVIQDVNVKVNITHTFTGDMELHLVAPDNTDIRLVDNRGSGGDNFTGTVLDDEAATPIASGTAPFTGSFRPDSPLTGMDGKNSLGAWTLRVLDLATVDTGTIDNWSITFTYPPQTCGPHASYLSNGLTESCSAGGPGNGNSYVDPGEDVVMPITVQNDGSTALTGIVGTLTSTTPGVTVTDDTASFPDLAGGGSGSSAAPHFAFTVDQGVLCGSMIDFKLNFSANEGGPWGSDFQVPVGAPAGATTTTSSTDVPKTILDLATVTSDIPIANPQTVVDLDVKLNITHTYTGDLILTLIGPTGTRTTLVNRRGASGNDFNNTIFDDEAATVITTGTPPYAGSFRPEQPLTTYDGAPGNGTWKLEVQDVANIDTGTLNSWSLTIVTNAPPTCSNCSLSPPAEVFDLVWGPGSREQLEWSSTAGASWYNLYAGVPSDLPDLHNPSNDSCRRSTQVTTTTGNILNTPGDLPPVGSFKWYLVRAGNGGGEGSAGSGTPGPRIQNSTGPCP